MKVIFLSDLHLGASYIANGRDHERRICKFLSEKCNDADHIYLLGDVLDYWYEYRSVVPKGFVRFFGTIASLADRGIKITWLTGNHDIWLFGYLRDELNIEVIDAPYIEREIGGETFVLSHGDRIGKSGLSFRIISSLFRNRLCQRLYASIHPRWTVPFAHRWSSNSRYSHIICDDDDTLHRKMIEEDAARLLEKTPNAHYIVLGHHHLMMDKQIEGSKCRLVVLGDWINNFSYAVYDENGLALHVEH